MTKTLYVELEIVQFHEETPSDVSSVIQFLGNNDPKLSVEGEVVRSKYVLLNGSNSFGADKNLPTDNWDFIELGVKRVTLDKPSDYDARLTYQQDGSSAPLAETGHTKKWWSVTVDDDFDPAGGYDPIPPVPEVNTEFACTAYGWTEFATWGCVEERTIETTSGSGLVSGLTDQFLDTAASFLDVAINQALGFNFNFTQMTRAADTFLSLRSFTDGQLNLLERAADGEISAEQLETLSRVGSQQLTADLLGSSGLPPLAVAYLAEQSFAHTSFNGASAEAAAVEADPYADGAVDYTAPFYTDASGNPSATQADVTFVAGDGDDRIETWWGDDTIAAGDGVDFVFARGGDDEISGGGGSDTLWGGSGRDVIWGGSGDDTIEGNDGDDYLDGGAGVDTVSFAFADRAMSVDLRFERATGEGRDTVRAIENVTGSGFSDWMSGDGGDNVLVGGAGDDRIKGQNGNDRLDGGEGNDRMRAGTGEDVLLGRDGDDVMEGLAGNDSLGGGLGDDYIYGGSGNDWINGGVGSDRLRGNRGDDLMDGGTGGDVMFGGGGHDDMSGSRGDDYLYGENGNDRLHGGAGTDRLFGGAGRDVFVFEQGDGADSIRDFQNGLDRIDLSDFALASFSQVAALGEDRPSGLRIDFGGGDRLFIDNFVLATFDAGDVIL